MQDYPRHPFHGAGLVQASTQDHDADDGDNRVARKTGKHDIGCQ